MSMKDRASGVLLAVSSLPSPYGIGTFGKAAYEFVDFLVEAHQSYWQVLPLGPTTYGDSPYQSYSAFAGNPYYIDLDMLIDEGLLTIEQVNSIDWTHGNACQVDYGTLFEHRIDLLRLAYKSYVELKSNCYSEQNGGNLSIQEFEKFKQNNAEWVYDYAVFMSLKEQFNYCTWNEWEDGIRNRSEAVLEKYKQDNKDNIEFWIFIQFLFECQWLSLKEYANSNGIMIIGDIPIYMGYDSADVWSHPECFELDDKLNSKRVAGVPPDAFSDTGQKWGNPLYDWSKLEDNSFKWWRLRMEQSAKLFDIIRIDHFIGIVKYYAIPQDMPDARQGMYEEGPADKLLAVINEAVTGKQIIAEDLGVYMPEVDRLIKANGYMNMKVMEFAFSGDKRNPHLPYNYERNCVVYGGTHDNETLMGYFMARNDEELSYAHKYLGVTEAANMVDEVFKMAYNSVAQLVIFAMQDVLKLGNEARMNFPSSIGGNWKWRLSKNMLDKEHEEYLRRYADTYGRSNK